MAAPAVLTRFRHGIDLSDAAPGTSGQLDDWQLVKGQATSGGGFASRLSFVLVFACMAAGAWARAGGRIDTRHADLLRRACFTALLPAFLLRHIWLCQVESGLYTVAVLSFVAHAVWLWASSKVAQALEPQDRQMRGWTMLMSQGAMNSFLYPLLLANEQFGEKAMACAVLWDIGGNMWTCQFALFAVAAYHRPGAVDDPVGPRNAEMEQVVCSDEEDSLLPSKIGASPLGARGAARPEQRGGSAVAAGPHACQALAQALPKPVLLDALSQPVLVCCVAGFALNVFGVPLPAALDAPLWAIGEPYKVALYFLVGYYGDHRVGPHEVRRMMTALGARYAIAALIMAAVLLLAPLEAVNRYTIVLALLSPCSSFVMHLVGVHGYGDVLLRLTVSGGFISTVLSTLVQSAMIAMFSPWLEGGA